MRSKVDAGEEDKVTESDGEDLETQPTSAVNAGDSDSSLTDLTLTLDLSPTAKPTSARSASSDLPSGKSWNFDPLNKASQAEDEHGNTMEVDDNADYVDRPVSGHPFSLARKDSLIDPQTDIEPDESSFANTPASTPTKSGLVSRPKRVQKAQAIAPSSTASQAAEPAQPSGPAPRATRSKPTSRAPSTSKPQSREVAALVGAGILGVGAGETNGPRKTRGQKKTLESMSPNASKAAKQRQKGVVDYTKMM
jgi:hypothetical protein